jgi:hypothetical protein
MPDAPPADLIAGFLQRYYRDPIRYREQASLEALALGDLSTVIRLALGRPVVLSDPSLRTPAAAAELARAAVLYIQQQFFRDGATHYETLGLAPEPTAEAIRDNFRLLMQLIHPDRHAGNALWPESCAAKANRAYSVLKSPRLRADYDREVNPVHKQRQPSVHAARGAPATASVKRASARVPARRQPRASAPLLPEWITFGLGGFIRDHPGFTAFAVLIAVSALMVAVSAWPDRDELLSGEKFYASTTATDTRPAGRAPTTSRGVPSPDSASKAVESKASTADGGAPGAGAVVAPPRDRVAEPGSVALAPSARAVAPSVAAAETTPVKSPSAPRGAVQAVSASASSDHAARQFAASPLAPGILTPASAVPAPEQSAAPPVTLPPVLTSASAAPAAAPQEMVVASVPIAQASAADRAPPPLVQPPPAAADVESLIAAFVSSYEAGTISVFANLFGAEAEANEQRGRVAIRGEYNQFFRSTAWRRMHVAKMNWQSVGDRTEAKGELLVRTGWHDGREVEQRVAVKMELVQQGGRTVIAKLSLQPR